MTVTVYTKPDCRQCDATKRYLSERDVSFEVESLEDAANLAAAKALGHMGAPVVVFAPDGRAARCRGLGSARTCSTPLWRR